MNKNNKKDEKIVKYVQLEQKDLDNMREVIRKMLELNIAYKEFTLELAKDEERLVDMCKSSINNSKKGLEVVEKIANPESFNSIFKTIGREKMQMLTEILGFVSGTLADDRFLEKDEEITQYKKTGEYSGEVEA